ncbi:MAG: acyl-CoA thioesterase [bacterium]|nr:acyl-CoA thioesterase [bacterium]
MARAKTPKFSETTMTEVVLPNDTNPMGMLQGGRLVQWMDLASAICAQTHADQICVTYSIDSLKFMAAARVGDIITIKAKVTRAFRTSMEIFVQAHSKEVLTRKKRLINQAFFTFVAINDKATSIPVPGIKPVTAEEIKEYENAEKRRNYRMKDLL